MTLSSTTVRNTYTGSASVGPFSYSFKITTASDLAVYRTDAAGTTTLLAYPTGYSVTGIGDATGGSITLATALAVDESLSIVRAVPETQPTSLRSMGTFLPDVHEDALDRLEMQIQQLRDSIRGSLRLHPRYDPANVLPLTPQANRVLAWNADGSGFDARVVDTASAALVPGNGRTVASLTSYLANNVVFNASDYGASSLNSPAVNTAAIQAAILASLNVTTLGQQPTGRRGVVVLQENYPVTTIYCPRYTQIRGAHRLAGLTGTADAPILVLGRSLAENDWLEISLSDLFITGDITKTSQHGIRAELTGTGAYLYPLSIKNVRVQDVGGDGLKINHDNIAGQALKTTLDNFEVIRAYGYATHIRVGILNAFYCVDSRFNNCGNGFFVEDFGSGTTNVEAMRFQNTQFESLGDPTGTNTFATGSFGFKSSQYEGQYSFDHCYFEGNGNKAADTTGANIWIKSPWFLSITGGVNVTSNNLVYIKEGGRTRIEGVFINRGPNNTAVFTLDGPPPGTGYGDLEIGSNFWGSDAVTSGQLVRKLNSPTTLVRGFTSPKNVYLSTTPRTAVQVFRDNTALTADAGAISYNAVKRLANNSGGSTSIANNGIASICKNTVSTMALVTEYNNSRFALFLLAAGRAPVLVAQDAAGKYTITKDTASSLNVYNDTVTTNSWVVQNTTGSTALLAVRFFGCEPMEHADDGYYETQFA